MTTSVPTQKLFQCRDYPIPLELKCDGIKQCVPDGIDEIDCPRNSSKKPAKKRDRGIADPLILAIDNIFITFVNSQKGWSNQAL